VVQTREVGADVGNVKTKLAGAVVFTHCGGASVYSDVEGLTFDGTR
jgi:hypothetical protein